MLVSCSEYIWGDMERGWEGGGERKGRTGKAEGVGGRKAGRRDTCGFLEVLQTCVWALLCDTVLGFLFGNRSLEKCLFPYNDFTVRLCTSGCAYQ